MEMSHNLLMEKELGWALFDYFCLHRGSCGFPSSFCFLEDDGMPPADSIFIKFSRGFRADGG
jgi:hypothetical protein